jgi:hypothetical protein
MVDEEAPAEVAEGVQAPSPEPLPDGDYAIVEVMGHRTLVGRVEEVERFGTKLCSIQPLFGGKLLPAVLIGGGSLYQFTPCTKEVAARRSPTQLFQLPPSIAAVLPSDLLPAPTPVSTSTYNPFPDEEPF